MDKKKTSESAPRRNRTICLPFSRETWDVAAGDTLQFRLRIDEMIAEHPELFPPGTECGWRTKDSYISKKQGIKIRRIEIGGVSHTVRPSFVMPYMTGMTDEAEKALFLRKFSVPFWGLAYVFGRDPMYWQRMEQSLGRNSIVGTTVRDAGKLPKHLLADEKHTSVQGEKSYVAVTAAEECILGASVADSAGEDSLKEAYGTYKEEARNIAPDYSPETVSTDGWKATMNAWKSLFPSVTLILCFLHTFIGIRDRAKKKFGEIYDEVVSKLWDCYRAVTRASFSQRVRRFSEWAEKASLPSVIADKIAKMRENIAAFATAYAFPGAHRTSNMLDRLMRMMDRHLFNTQYFHGFIPSAELSVRGWALIFNFTPSNPYTVKKYDGLQSRAERFNGFRYHENWLHNLLISASLGGFGEPPLNPL
ncbi:hypothetical protein [Desulfonema magnum]|uniref:Transposase n=1 Tax=Desulfonema magnum TaxID=45655 RepID=A0A975GPN0_9BACT|nr:hypothetical protein [Desulfonema magnum]QTA89022.1 Uncharacterized protein dnm_050690 [Desulfonema magnum]